MNETRNLTKTISQAVIVVVNGTHDSVYPVDWYDTSSGTMALISILVMNITTEGNYTLVPPCPPDVTACDGTALSSATHTLRIGFGDINNTFAALYLDIVPVPGVWKVLSGEAHVASFTLDQQRDLPLTDSSSTRVLLGTGERKRPTRTDTGAPGEECFELPGTKRVVLEPYHELPNRPQPTGRDPFGNPLDWFAIYAIRYWGVKRENLCLPMVLYDNRDVAAVGLTIRGPTHPAGELAPFKVYAYLRGFAQGYGCEQWKCRVRWLTVTMPEINVKDVKNSHEVFGLTWVGGSKDKGHWIEAGGAILELLSTVKDSFGVIYTGAKALYALKQAAEYEFGADPGCGLGCVEFDYMTWWNTPASVGTNNLVLLRQGEHLLTVEFSAELIWYDGPPNPAHCVFSRGEDSCVITRVPLRRTFQIPVCYDGAQFAEVCKKWPYEPSRRS